MIETETVVNVMIHRWHGTPMAGPEKGERESSTAVSLFPEFK
jgi:hypothetical protein